jgi:hypothetical protein
LNLSRVSVRETCRIGMFEAYSHGGQRARPTGSLLPFLLHFHRGESGHFGYSERAPMLGK